MTAIIVDLDGTLCDDRHRRHHIERSPRDWDQYHAGIDIDPPIPMVRRFVNVLAGMASIYYATGRPERYRDATRRWLEEFDMPPGPLAMRPDADYRSSPVVKREMFPDVEFALALEDREDVARMWEEERHIMTFRVSPISIHYSPVSPISIHYSPVIVSAPGEESPAMILYQAINLFQEKNGVYRDAYKRLGDAAVAMFPDGLHLKSSRDFTRAALAFRLLDKMLRYGGQFKDGHADSLMDLITGASMLASYDTEEEL